jgi:hypothetical protein
MRVYVRECFCWEAELACAWRRPSAFDPEGHWCEVVEALCALPEGKEQKVDTFCLNIF